MKTLILTLATVLSLSAAAQELEFAKTFDANYNEEKNTYNFGLFNFEFHKEKLYKWVFHEDIKAKMIYKGVVHNANGIKMQFEYTNEQFKANKTGSRKYQHPNLFTKDSDKFNAQVTFDLVSCDGEDLTGSYQTPTSLFDALKQIDEFDFEEFYSCKLIGNKVLYSTRINSELLNLKMGRYNDNVRNAYYYGKKFVLNKEGSNIEIENTASLLSIVVSNSGQDIEFEAKPIPAEFPDRNKSEKGNINKFETFATTYTSTNAVTISDKDQEKLEELKVQYVSLIKDFVREIAPVAKKGKGAINMVTNNYALKKGNEIRLLKKDIYRVSKKLPIIDALSLIFSMNKAYGYVEYYENLIAERSAQ
jgi:hypothetical protein